MAYVDEDGSSGSGEDVHMLDGHKRHQVVVPSGSGGRKRSRKANGDAIVDAMLEIAAASKMRANAILKNEDSAREIFISLKGERRLPWLQCKLSAPHS
ncbi:hypothetical protein DEO72_LG9g2556 [Vigna unguiculata]|uniref:Uncharacterized protein n=1 Tax=Vigna unguiculata TaxID=3917 RepID=A0A4D6N1A2_VIGUN|nr:hypothetical protein DEO72_LG9g2556 [Vigna unguiculata]